MKKIMLVLLLYMALANSSWATPLMLEKLGGINSDEKTHETLIYAFEDGKGISDGALTLIKEPFGSLDLAGMTGEDLNGGDSGIIETGKESGGNPMPIMASFQKTAENGGVGDAAVQKTNPLPESGSMLLLGIGLISLASIREKFKF